MKTFEQINLVWQQKKNNKRNFLEIIVNQFKEYSVIFECLIVTNKELTHRQKTNKDQISKMKI